MYDIHKNDYCFAHTCTKTVNNSTVKITTCLYQTIIPQW